MSLIKCRECAKEVSSEASSCPHCGCPININNPEKELNDEKQDENKEENMVIEEEKFNKFFKIIFISVGVFLLVVILIISNNKEKINETGTTYSEYLDIINKYEDDIDFSGVINGSNCVTGLRTKIVESKKYGKVTIDFSYCKYNNSLYIHVYN